MNTYRTLGTINNRVSIGENTATGNLFIHGSSNCIEFSREEMDTLITALIVAQRLPHEFAGQFLGTSGSVHMLLWKPFVETK